MSTKQFGFLTVMLVVLAMGSILFTACARPGTTPTAGNGTPTAGTGGGGTTVHMGPTSFLVSTISIPKGSKLTLIDDAAVPHIIENGTYDANGTPLPGKTPGAPNVSVQFSGSDTHDIGPFTTAGTFHIYCTIHVNMDLAITVK